VTAPSGPLWLEADPVRLEQVIANLLNNAAKYTPPGGRIGLTAEAAERQVTVAVRDTGIGFPQEVASRLFEPFVQGELPADVQGGGLGIGLALVRGLVELHGGEVLARSPGPGLGSEFLVRLTAPLHAGPPAGWAAPEEADAVSARPLSVLIVEDDRDTAHSLATLIELWGHRPHTAADGLAGLAAASSPGGPPPDVALLDLGLPGMDGCELARELRTRLGPELLLVALTGYGQEEDRRRTREAGFDHHFVKPIAPQTLRHLLADWSKQPRPAA
jgi:CheY-like chemotaxis protein